MTHTQPGTVRGGISGNLSTSGRCARTSGRIWRERCGIEFGAEHFVHPELVGPLSATDTCAFRSGAGSSLSDTKIAVGLTASAHREPLGPEKANVSGPRRDHGRNNWLSSAREVTANLTR